LLAQGREHYLRLESCDRSNVDTRWPAWHQWRAMVSFLKKLFGGGGSGEPEAGEAIEYNGYRIRPTPYRAEGQFQTAGTIEKDFPEGTKEHRFVRAERHASKDEAAAFAISKGRQIIDERGDKVFD
jgi:hypothetical protein